MKISAFVAVAFFSVLAAGCANSVKSNLAECKVNAEKVVATDVRGQPETEEFRKATLTQTCMESRGFKFDSKELQKAGAFKTDAVFSADYWRR